MERDFLGLNSNEPLAVVKDDVNTDKYEEIGLILLFAFLLGLESCKELYEKNTQIDLVTGDWSQIA
ncbi:hypothetical protein Godav_019711 [Gossypium davidsonii]|uniref:Uncharacterized protein n=1 Tax=Gossypium davidsonii TaxID=34287 RepID=A0A7J8R0P4_GOSDV|nr:hypothetical protein [Gossypium davidsonii]